MSAEQRGTREGEAYGNALRGKRKDMPNVSELLSSLYPLRPQRTGEGVSLVAVMQQPAVTASALVHTMRATYAQAAADTHPQRPYP